MENIIIAVIFLFCILFVVLFWVLESKFGLKFALIIMDTTIILIAVLVFIPDDKEILLYIIPVVFLFNLRILSQYKSK